MRSNRTLDRRQKVLLFLCFVVLATLSVLQIGRESTTSLEEFTGSTMGTTYSVKVSATLSPETRATVAAVIEQRRRFGLRLRQVVHARGNDPERAGYEFLRAAALGPVA